MKLAIISDIHASTKWIGNLPILEQTEMLAQRLVDYCHLNGISELVIAGDIVDKSIDRSEVMHTVNHIFSLWSRNFNNVYYILGQHDMTVNPIGEIDIKQSPITILEFPNVHYVPGQIIQIGGTKVGFSNFSRNSAYKLPEYVDLYITHFTISERFGQVIDRTKFGVMIAGDIHHRVSIGNCYSIGSFQQQSVAKDSPLNNVVIWDCDSKSFTRGDIGGGLRMEYSPIHSGLVDGVWYELKRQPRQVNSNACVDKFADDNYSKIVEKVREFMEEKQLTEMNSEVASQIKDVHSFSTDFVITYLRVHNFMKLKDTELNFNEGDKVLLTGSNGSGKSTFLNALFAAITGNVTWSHYIGKFDSEVYTELGIIYNGVNYFLRRGSGYQYLKVDGSEVSYKNRNDFNGVVALKLPFLTELGILFQRPEVGTLFEGINSDTKLNLVSKVYHLEYLDQLYSTGENIKQSYVKKLNELGYNLKQLEISLGNLNSKLSDLNITPDLTQSIEQLKVRYDELILMQSNAQRYSEVSNKVTKLKSDILANQDLIKHNDELLSKLDTELHKSNLSKYETLVNAKSEYNSIKSKISEIESKLTKVNSDIESLESNKCPRCGQVWISEESVAELSKLKSVRDELTPELESLKLKLEIYNSPTYQFELIPTLESEISTYNTTLNSCNSTKLACSKRISEITEEIASYNLPEEVTFTSDNLTELLNIKDTISKISQYLELKSELDRSQDSYNKQLAERDEYQRKVDELGLYNWYVCKSGPIYHDIIESLCESWSNDRVKFSAFEGTYRGNNYLDIKISYLKGSNWQDYSQSSSGEKSYMDILFIKSVTANAGFLILDEFLRHMDPDLTERSIDEIKSMNVNLFILSSFNPNLYFANRNLRTEYIPSEDECRLTVD